jgi:chorismate mutase-like protein
MSAMKIGDWRAKIDAIDTTLLHLLNVRAGFALEVGRLKGESGQPLRVPAREREILERMVEINPGPLDTAAVETIYQRILDESIRIQVQHGLGTADEIPPAAHASAPRKNTPSRSRKEVSA